MHELGHNLGLDHGVAWRPNYLSVMNYAFQLTGLVTPHGGFAVDYSRAELAPLDESWLEEPRGLDPDAGVGLLGTTYFCNAVFAVKSPRFAAGPVDWDCDGAIGGPATSDLNLGGAVEVLHGTEDWSRLVFTGGSIGALGRLPAPPPETVADEPEAGEFTARGVFARPSALSAARPAPRPLPPE